MSRVVGAIRIQLPITVVFAVAMALALAILLHFHDRFWWAPDEGAYAHVAERVLQGEVLNGTVQDVHMGYVNFANALAFKAFGVDLISLRYPLIVMTLIQSALVFWLLSGRGAPIAFGGTLGMSALSLVQFLNPTAHWYALFLCTLVLTLLAAGWHRQRGGLVLLGFLLITLFLFRQLSGIFAAMGALTFLLLQYPSSVRDGRPRLARILAVCMLAGLITYLYAKIDAPAALLFGGAPVLLLGYAAVRTRLADQDAGRLLLWLATGGIMASLPLVAYHLWHGSLVSWWHDTVVSAVLLTELDFVRSPRYLGLAQMGLVRVLTAGRAAEFMNGAFWFLLPLLPALLGLRLLHALGRGQPERCGVLPIVAVFFALVSVHYQIPLYLFYSTPLTMAGLLALAPAGWAARFGWAGTCLGLVFVGLVYQAAQPLSRGLHNLTAGDVIRETTPTGLERASLRITHHEAALYRHLVDLIRRESESGDSILALPVNPELYFLGERRNPLRFFNAALGLNSAAAVDAAEAALAADPPRLVFYRPEDKYNTPAVRDLMAGLRDGYRLIETRDGFQVFLRRDEG